jgi:hypothetical protein
VPSEKRVGSTCRASPRSRPVGCTYPHLRPLEAGHIDAANRFSGYSWFRIVSIMSVPIGSFWKGMKFRVRIAYSLSMPFGVAASRFSCSRRSSLVFMIAAFDRLFVMMVGAEKYVHMLATPGVGIPVPSHGRERGLSAANSR